jgi:16S rRNA (uracil1498-N3)-methyltransferase
MRFNTPVGIADFSSSRFALFFPMDGSTRDGKNRCMHRFYLPPEACQGGELVLKEGEAHHAAKVLRVQRGETVMVLDGAGRVFACTVREASRTAVILAIKSQESTPPPPCQITLLQAVPKGKLMEAIIQKATELGAHRVVPLLTQRVAVQLGSREAASKQEKWQQTAIEAIKQSGSAWLPRVETPLTPKDFLARHESFELPLVASLQEDSRHARHYFNQFAQEQGRAPGSLGVWVGPEGDFTPEEMEAIKKSGAHPITLGRLVLRCETAATYCLSMANYEVQWIQENRKDSALR